MNDQQFKSELQAAVTTGLAKLGTDYSDTADRAGAYLGVATVLMKQYAGITVTRITVGITVTVYLGLR